MSFLDELKTAELESPPLARRPKDDVEAYGTSEGVRKEWDTRGRVRKEADDLVTVYHGKKLGKGTAPMNAYGFYVTLDKAFADKWFGDTHVVQVPKSELHADPEVEGFEGKRMNGYESLQKGSAVAPHKYYGDLKPVASEPAYWIYNKEGRRIRVTIPEDEMMAHNDPDINAYTGTRKTGYSEGKYGPFRCDNCIHFEKQQSGCDNTHILKDSELEPVHPAHRYRKVSRREE